jgi:hypothetical protein
MQCILYKIYFWKVFIYTIIWYAFLYALLFAQNFILEKKESGCYTVARGGGCRPTVVSPAMVEWSL